MKTVRIWSFFGPHFPYFRALRIQSECGNIRTRKTANTDTFSQCHPADLASEKGAFLSATDTNILSSSEDNNNNNNNNNSNNNNDNGDDGNNNINTGDITYSKTFWRTVKPFFTDKTKTKYNAYRKKNCSTRRSRGNSFRKNNYRRSGCSRSF